MENPTMSKYLSYATELAHSVHTELVPSAHSTASNPVKILVEKTAGHNVSLDLTPIALQHSFEPVTDYLENVTDIASLLNAYRQLRADFVFEQNLPAAMRHVHPYANYYIDYLFNQAQATFSNTDACLIARWVSHLDAYTAVKAIESLLNSKADLKLLAIAAPNHWQVHFDHMAIRCGNQSNQDAERVVDMLIREHHYRAPQVADEAFYRFADGWNAYVLFKVLTNGQVLRVFVDQSDADQKQQIIQHWNRVYGYTAHHLAIRATRVVNTVREAVPLTQIMQCLKAEGIETLQATGVFTAQLLEQVFTRPEQNRNIPKDLLAEIARFGSTLPRVLENGKLLEIVARREVPETFKAKYFALYGIYYDPANPLHSVPIYNYFLPEQAAHVIRTSVQVN